MATTTAYLYWLIVGCEVGFWVVLALALAARYMLRRDKLSRLLLLALPALDVLLLAFTAWDLRSGASATFAHGLAAAYVGFTVAFGSVAVAWADQHFAHWFAAGPRPTKPPTQRWPALRYELGLWFRCIAAATVTTVLVALLIAIVDDPARTEHLNEWFRIAFGSVVFWFIFGPLWTAVFPGKQTPDA